MQYPSIKYINEHISHRKFYLNRDFPGFLDDLDSQYPHIQNLSEKLWLYFHNLSDRPECPICGNAIKTFINFNRGYVKYCCPTCAQKDPTVRIKTENTNISRYGKDYHKEISEKGRMTKLQKYGDPNYNNPEKIKLTCIGKYGVDNVMKSPDVVKKGEITCIEKYGATRKILSHEYRVMNRNRLDEKLKKRYPEVVDILNDGTLFVCKCTDDYCSKCTEKQFQIGYDLYYERKFIYNTEICPIKNRLFFNRDTYIEKFVKNILNEYHISYESNNRSILGGKELDIYIPEYKIAIECNGIYWHSTANPNNLRMDYHYDKWNECKKQGIQLITIWEDQIVNKPEIIKSIILSKLGIYKTRIMARQCDIRSVSSRESMEFLNKNHLQGFVSSSIRMGLYYNNELISIMVFGRKRKALGSEHTDNTWELYRYCCNMETQVVGGVERLFKHFLMKHPGCMVESFSSNDISDGGLYGKIGFQLAGGRKYSYWYVDRQFQRYHRYVFRKDVLVKHGADPNMTEFQITENMGLYRIYDSGQQKWIYKF